MTHERVVIDWQASDPSLTATVYKRTGTADPWRVIGSITAPGTGRLAFEDTGVRPGASHFYRLGIRDDSGGEFFAGEVAIEVPSVPSVHLRLPGSNPARIGHEVEVQLGPREPATLVVFDVSGRRLSEKRLEAAAVETPKRIRLSDLGLVSPGMYVVRLRQGDDEAALRVVLLN